ncbi:NmrA family NAD(P)-binding protein [Pseudomonas aeruginosa]|uniref:NmrA family NAD(P)-binding protein n=1 Tax=Pseudomonas aeruginosa TaxID=287 RepID=UPI001559E167|nr:NmrA family NAD(P)-binding protein [Pseudomonas aeruginosa]MBG6712420.1 NmrA family NAD(P)-binding protein [Pseudomonas aeruginosa]MBG7425665.1 NmrA family NAD(P)-binding protein [Pseudomonas aeruginosa]MBO2830210.1 NmrA family NAD(P)-binding protein [Pseudomonas aeruginosa]NPW36420.1 NmrA family NAD(P)-binding protein [Pseudomonas aeruginosa]WCV78897.1 NmrA family NAD(P)-binding protein [Pseudomonas aeruginosa]
MSTYPYVVFGVSGRTGAAAADALLHAGQPVRVVVRDAAKGKPWAERGAEVAVADVTDVGSMTEALRRARGAYVVSPQHYTRDDLFVLADRVATTIARAARAADVPRLIALSSIGADRTSGTGWIAMNRLLEQRLQSSAIPTTFLRAVYFMENWTSLVAQALRTGTLPSFLGPLEQRFPMVATRDVGHVAADLLVEEEAASDVVTLEGPQRYAPAEVCAAIQAATGRSLGVQLLPEPAWPDALAQSGFSQAAVAGFSELTRGINSGHIVPDSDPYAERRVGTTALTEVIAKLVADLAGPGAHARRASAGSAAAG